MRRTWFMLAAVVAGVFALWQVSQAQLPEEDFPKVMAKMKAAKPEIEKKHAAVLEARYDLADKPGDGKMTRGKSLQQGPRAKLPEGQTWAKLAAMTPGEIREKGLFPAGY